MPEKMLPPMCKRRSLSPDFKARVATDSINDHKKIQVMVADQNIHLHSDELKAALDGKGIRGFGHGDGIECRSWSQ